MSTSPRFVGIDIGAGKLHVATSPDAKQRPKVIDLKDADWHDQIAAIVGPGSVVAVEPTGWHYSNPTIMLLTHLGARVFMVEHHITGHLRAFRVSGIKKDSTDAAALCYIAQEVAERPGSVRGVRQVDPALSGAVTALRMLIWPYMRADKESTRATNRLTQLAFSVWPALSQHLTAYRHAIQHGAVTPQELHSLADPAAHHLGRPKFYNHASRRKELIALADAVPTWLKADHLRTAIIQEETALTAAEQRKAELESLITDAIWLPPFTDLTQLWSSLPHSGPTHIAAILVACKGFPPGMNRKQFTACMGAFPSIAQSGEQKEERAARQGFRPAKRAINIWTLGLIRHGENPVAAHFKARVGVGQQENLPAARAKLCSLLYGIAHHSQPYDAARGVK